MYCFPVLKLGQDDFTVHVTAIGDVHKLVVDKETRLSFLKTTASNQLYDKLLL